MKNDKISEVFDEIWISEMYWIHSLILEYPMHESLWSHYYFLVSFGAHVGIQMKMKFDLFLKRSGHDLYAIRLVIRAKKELSLAEHQSNDLGVWVAQVLNSNKQIPKYIRNLGAGMQ